MGRFGEGRPEAREGQYGRPPGAVKAGARILLATFGSLGDLHPYIALALGLKARGHRPLVAASEFFRGKVEGEGIEFASLRPDIAEFVFDPACMRRIMHPRRGTEHVVRRILFPRLRESYEDLLGAARGADLLVSHPLTYPVPLVAEKLGLPWVQTILQPVLLLSTHDPPVLPFLPAMGRLRRLGPAFHRVLFGLLKAAGRTWSPPLFDLWRRAGLPPPADPLFAGQFSPHLNLALFSPVLGEPQPDWPVPTVQAGFAFYDREDPSAGMPRGLARFLEEGEPPLVFTLGSAAVLQAGAFYRESAAAAASLGRRAVLLAGPLSAELLRGQGGKAPAVFPYAPYSELFPKAAAVIHHGGVGTTAQVLRAGVPQLVVPYAHDQFDNAARVTRQGLGRSLPRLGYSARKAARVLKRLLEDPDLARKAVLAGERVQAEDAVGAACAELERLLPPSAGAGGDSPFPQL